MTQVDAISFDYASIACDGVQSIIDVVDLRPYTDTYAKDGALSAWTSLTLANGKWAQIGYAARSPGLEAGFLQIWTPSFWSSLLGYGATFTTVNFPITLGQHAFGIIYDSQTLLWNFTVDDEIVYQADLGTRMSVDWNSIPTFQGPYCGIENSSKTPYPLGTLAGSRFPIDITFPLALATRVGGLWRQVSDGHSLRSLNAQFGVVSPSPNVVVMGPNEATSEWNSSLWVGFNTNPPILPTTFRIKQNPAVATVKLSNPVDTFQRIWALFLDIPPGKYLGGGLWQNSSISQLVSSARFSGDTWVASFNIPSGQHTIYVATSQDSSLFYYSGSVNINIAQQGIGASVNFVYNDTTSSAAALNASSLSATFGSSGIFADVAFGPDTPPWSYQRSNGLITTSVLISGGAALAAGAYLLTRKRRRRTS